MASKNLPAIRFAGFEDVWQVKRLSKMATFSKGRGYSKSDLRPSGNPIILYGRLYTQYQLSISSVDTFADARKHSVFSVGGEVIVPSSGETAEDIAVASVIEEPHIIIGGDLNIIYPNRELDPKFLAANITNGSPHIDLSKKAQGKSVVHMHNKDIEDIDIIYPNIYEQNKISTLLCYIDSIIAILQQKVIKLKNFKQAMLEKLFPRPGENVPEVRFAGFSGEWKIRKLSDIAEIIGGGTPSTNNPECWNGNINWFTPAEIDNQIYVSESERKISIVGLKNSSTTILPAHRTMLFTSRAGIGKTAILKAPAATNQGFQSLIMHDGIDPYFIFSMTNLIKDKAEQVASGSTFSEISGKILGNLKFMFPSSKEQQRIGEYFKKTDCIIKNSQQKITKLQNLKKSLLNKMFV